MRLAQGGFIEACPTFLSFRKMKDEKGNPEKPGGEKYPDGNVIAFERTEIFAEEQGLENHREEAYWQKLQNILKIPYAHSNLM